MNKEERKLFSQWLKQCPIDWKYVSENEERGLITYLFFYKPYKANTNNVQEETGSN